MRLLIIALVLLFIGAGALLWASGTHEGRINTTSTGVAIDGYDPVAYFTQGAAVPGDAEYAYRWDDAIWHFSSADHRDHFIADPESYAPAFGGYSARINRRFLDDLTGNIARAEANWPRIRSELEAGASE